MNVYFVPRTVTRVFSLRAVRWITLIIAASGPVAAEPPTGTSTDLFKDFVENCVRIEPGKGNFPLQFQMGGQYVSPWALPQRTTEMSHAFRISRFEMTQDLYKAIMGSNPSRWTGPRNSVESMSFRDAEVFCARLTTELRAAKLIAADEIVRLPTEAEWEYCCRAGTDTLYSFGNSASLPSDPEGATSILNEYAWHTGNAAGNDPAVGVLKPNPWGLFDVHGYLWEYVSDVYAADAAASPDPANSDKANPNSTKRIIRGGSWRDPAASLTCGSRRPISMLESSDAIGFRCVISQTPQP